MSAKFLGNCYEIILWGNNDGTQKAHQPQKIFSNHIRELGTGLEFIALIYHVSILSTRQKYPKYPNDALQKTQNQFDYIYDNNCLEIKLEKLIQRIPKHYYKLHSRYPLPSSTIWWESRSTRLPRKLSGKQFACRCRKCRKCRFDP